MATLSAGDRARLPDSAFAYIDSTGVRRLPIHDASHVRNALARFEQVGFEDDAAREQARQRLLRAAKKHGIVPLGFFDGQLRKERAQSAIKAGTTPLRSLPRGAVTFLLTDMEGSTQLLERLGDAYARVLRDVRAIIRDRVRRAGGHEVDARADEFFAVFARAADAIGAAMEVQRGLRARAWPRKANVCVRIGLHTGRSTLTETGYVGIAVHTAARICSAGHGGQILVSSATRAALDAVAPRRSRGAARSDEALADVGFRSLGEYSLPGLSAPLTLFQAEASDLPSTFPRLRAR